MTPRLRLLAGVALVLVSSSASLWAEGAACCEKPVSRASMLTSRGAGQGRGTAPAVTQVPAQAAPVAESRTKRIILGIVLGGFWMRGNAAPQTVAEQGR